MKRREFLATVVALAATHSNILGEIPPLLSPTLPDPTAVAFDEALTWLSDKGWLRHLAEVTGVSSITYIKSIVTDRALLMRELTPVQLARIKASSGFADFGGSALVVPGRPAHSLLYFAVASGDVKLQTSGDPDPACYPTLDRIEAIENLIYVLAPAVPMTGKHVLAVFAYEFRPREKTPHGAYADMVYSRTGISRVGSDACVWNPVERRYTSQVDAAGSRQRSAVVPARFGLFFAEEVDHKTDSSRFGRIGCPPNERDACFLLPIRKIVDGDPMLGGARLSFSESHRDEKLARLFDALLHHNKQMKIDPAFDLTSPPFTRQNASIASGKKLREHNLEPGDNLVDLVQTSSSALLAPQSRALVIPAYQKMANGKKERACFIVPPAHGNAFGNRRYTTLKMVDAPFREALGLGVADDITFPGEPHVTRFNSPKNGPEFVNIRHRVEPDGTVTPLGPGVLDWEKTIAAGGYPAALFLDGLCDGCVHAQLDPVHPQQDIAEWEELSECILPAFSIVSAPDFFSRIDPIDLDVAEFADVYGEGGVEVVSGARVHANPFHHLPGTTAPAFPFRIDKHLTGKYKNVRQIENDCTLTVTAVLSAASGAADDHEFCSRDTRVPRDFPRTNTLPDASSNVFAPGWDLTYSTIKKIAGTPEELDNDHTVYFASFGLGSPFPEDMKLCAAANGMWAALSPDAARTFYGKLKPIPTTIFGMKKRRTTTVLPLLDTEIGQHPESPAGRNTRGWDGEQGPFLSVSATLPRKLQVNYTDIGRADYVVNAQNGLMDMQTLQTLSVDEARYRMAAMQKCLQALPEHYQPRRSNLWLISAEAVADWSLGAKGEGIPPDLFGHGDRRWATSCKTPGCAAPGYMYVFARLSKAKRDEKDVVDPKDPKRLVADLERVYVCQAIRNKAAEFSQDLAAWTIHWVMLQASSQEPAIWN